MHAPIANLPNSIQLGGTTNYSSKLHLGPCSSVGMRNETDRHTQTAVASIHFAWLWLAWSSWFHCYSASENPQWFIILILACPGCSGDKAVKQLLFCWLCLMQNVSISQLLVIIHSVQCSTRCGSKFSLWIRIHTESYTINGSSEATVCSLHSPLSLSITCPQHCGTLPILFIPASAESPYSSHLPQPYAS